MKFSSVLVVAGIAGAVDAAQDICRALVLSGGGNNGSWEAGVFHGLVNNATPADYAYDVVTGVSAGSINTLAFAGWEIGREVEMSTWISDLWRNLNTSDVWKDWPLGKVSGVTIMGGAVDNSPLLNFMQDLIVPFDGYKRKVTLSTVDVDNGVYTEFD